MKISWSVLLYYLRVHKINDIHADELLRLEKRFRKVNRSLCICSLVLAIMISQGYVNHHQNELGENIVYISKSIGGWSVLSFVIFAIFTAGEWIRITYVTYQRLKDVRRRLKFATERFARYFGKGLLVNELVSEMKNTVGLVLIDQAMFILNCKDRKDKTAENKAREELRDMFDSAVEFCPVVGYNSLFIRAHAEIAKVRKPSLIG